MYPNLFGNPSLGMYDIIGVLGYLLILAYFLWKKTWSPALDVETPKKGKVWLTLLPLLVHLITYTFGGKQLGGVVNRATEFFGYVAVSAVAMALAAATLGAKPLEWLDKTTPLYLLLASVLKLSCFCGGCCYGRVWVYGLYNYLHQQWEFPIQLVEAAVYGLLFVLLSRYQGRPGVRFALFLTGYAGVRFIVQFFRADMAVFSSFHWMSAVFFAIGVVCWTLFSVNCKKSEQEV